MSALTRRENIRVIVEPDLRYAQGAALPLDKWERIALEACSEIMDNVKRHVDDVGSVHVDYERKTYCEYCGALWTEDSRNYNGGCCQADYDNATEEEHA